MSEITVNANQVATASSETSNAIGQISDGAQNQLHAMSQVATAVTQSGQAISEVAKDTALASSSSQESVRLVTGGQEKVAQMVEVVNVIALNSTNINKITEVIGAIANQTNMLLCGDPILSRLFILVWLESTLCGQSRVVPNRADVDAI